MATSLRVLLHDTQKSTSLLQQLSLKSNKFYDGCSDSGEEIQTENNIRVGSFCGLVGIGVGLKESFVPYLDEVPGNIFKEVLFDEYWNKIIFIDQGKNSLSRKDVILAIANQDGGAHVDPQIDDKYKKLARENALGWMASADGKEWTNMKGVELAAIRQIAHEILKTLIPNYKYKKITVTGNGLIMGGMGIWLGLQPKRKIGRNEKCFCGSGKKYKKCHGKNN